MQGPGQSTRLNIQLDTLSVYGTEEGVVPAEDIDPPQPHWTYKDYGKAAIVGIGAAIGGAGAGLLAICAICLPGGNHTLANCHVNVSGKDSDGYVIFLITAAGAAAGGYLTAKLFSTIGGTPM